jgi:hypothetical protein
MAWSAKPEDRDILEQAAKEEGMDIGDIHTLMI